MLSAQACLVVAIIAIYCLHSHAISVTVYPFVDRCAWGEADTDCHSGILHGLWVSRAVGPAARRLPTVSARVCKSPLPQTSMHLCYCSEMCRPLRPVALLFCRACAAQAAFMAVLAGTCAASCGTWYCPDIEAATSCCSACVTGAHMLCILIWNSSEQIHWS